MADAPSRWCVRVDTEPPLLGDLLVRLVERTDCRVICGDAEPAVRCHLVITTRPDRWGDDEATVFVLPGDTSAAVHRDGPLLIARGVIERVAGAELSAVLDVLQAVCPPGGVPGPAPGGSDAG